MGSTQNSTKVLLSRTLKKLEKVGAKDGVEATAGSPAKATPKKRKAKDEADETPKSKKGRKGKNDSPVDGKKRFRRWTNSGVLIINQQKTTPRIV